MRAAPDAVLDFLGTSNVCWRTDLITVTLLDGTVYRWANADVSIELDGDMYTAGPVVSRTIRQSSRLEIDTLELELIGQFLVGSSTLGTAANSGLFDDARVRVDHVLGAYPGDLSLGVISSWFEGRVSGVDPGPTGVRMLVQSDLEELARTMLPRRLYQLSCNYAVYDARCGLVKATWTTTGTVAGTPTVNAFASGLTAADSFYNLGVVTFTSGALTGVRRAVRAFAHTSGVVTCALPLPVAPTAGDTFTIFPGCSRTWTACTAFSNTAAFSGFPHIPTSQGKL